MTATRDFPYRPTANRTPARGSVPVAAFFFDTYGTVCDFFQPFKRALDALAERKGVGCDSAALAITWRNAYIRSIRQEVSEQRAFRPLRTVQREDVLALLSAHFPARVDDADIDEMVTTWRKLEPWPDAIPGLMAIKQHAIVAPLSNGNFDDMVALARHAGLPWDVILGSSLARAYKPHPDVYLKAAEALNLEPGQTCMVAAHQMDLHYAAGHGMQTAFVPRPLEFGGATRPRVLQAGVDYSRAAEIHADADWTYIARDFVDLATQNQADRR